MKFLFIIFTFITAMALSAYAGYICGMDNYLSIGINQGEIAAKHEIIKSARLKFPTPPCIEENFEGNNYVNIAAKADQLIIYSGDSEIKMCMSN